MQGMICVGLRATRCGGVLEEVARVDPSRACVSVVQGVSPSLSPSLWSLFGVICERPLL